MRVFISGASGNVGKALVRTIHALEGYELAGGWCKEAGEDIGTLAGIGPIGVLAVADIRAGLDASEPDIVIDFSSTSVLTDNLEVYAEKNLTVVIGTTGITDEQLAPFEKIVREKKLRWAAISNYGLGISLVQDFIKAVSQYYPYVSIIDRHRPDMANAPSGTAVDLAKKVNGANGTVASRESYPCVLGAKVDNVQILSQRMPWPGPYSEHEIIMGRPDEIIRIKVEDHSSEIYMDGVVLTMKRLPSMPGGTFVRELSEVRD